ncbi:hypothetical protein J4E05_07125 [Thalassospira sp. NFXS8]|jgi:hypothetical protein|uniref:hypothetical protein n=1 Tax=Thalassospira sp. NFXS8 TaxID=2819093 RepID=UPI0032DEDCCD
MFIIWRGWGILLPLAALIGALISMLVFGLVEQYVPQQMLPAFIMLGATLAVFQTVRWLERSDKGRELLDEKTGETVLLKRGDSIFFIKVRYWAYLFAILTLVMFVTSLSTVFGSGN